jgi:hypothetical protein
MDMPIVALQLEQWKRALRRVLLNTANNQYYGAICLGPPGCGKGKVVEVTAAECDVRLILVPPGTTLYGFVAMLRRYPHSTFWLDDYGDWASDPVFLDTLKKALETAGPRWVGAVSRDTLRGGIDPFLFYGKIIITSNINLKLVPAKLAPHVAALSDRAEPVNISWDPSERLRYIYWLVADQDYFRSPVYLRDQNMAHRQLSRELIVDVLDFMHTNAYQIEPSLRNPNGIVRERVAEPQRWYLNLLVAAPEPERWPNPVPPVPDILSSVERAGTTSGWPRGKKARRAAQRDAKCAEGRAASAREAEDTDMESAVGHILDQAATGETAQTQCPDPGQDHEHTVSEAADPECGPPQQQPATPVAPSSVASAGLKNCAIIYAPAGQAGEYSALATNPYRGCGHGCVYCYVPRTIHMKREEFDKGAELKDLFLERLRIDAAKYQAAGTNEQVMLSFTSDPYHRGDTQPTRDTLKILVEHGMAFCTLTKGGTRALRDLDLFRPDRDAFACTLTSLDDAFAMKWEPLAALPGDRIAALKAFHEAGIFTWVSLEPTLNIESSLSVVEAVHSFVDLFKVGRANDCGALTKTTDWEGYTHRMVDLMHRLGQAHYIKKDLQPFLPPGYHNPLRVPQHH